SERSRVPRATAISPLSLHDALPIWYELSKICFAGPSGDLDNTTVAQPAILTTSVAILEAFIESVNAKLGHRSSDGVEPRGVAARSEEHTSELQSPYDLVCRLLLEKK